MNNKKQKTAAKAFCEYWLDRGYEKGESQPFWLSLLRDVLGVESPEKFILFEEQVHLDHTSFIDGFIPSTHVLIEQKGAGKDLRKPIRQSDGSFLTPFQQAQRYSAVLPYSQRPRWIVTCNFDEFLIYDMEKPTGEPECILLKDLEKEYYRLQFLVDAEDENIRREMEISIQAGRVVGKLYDEILKQYRDPENDESLKSLNKLIVRIVFCLYSEDAGVFGGHSKFHDYIKSFSARDMRRALIDLFKMLDTAPENRNPYEDELLSSFPYVSGGLFSDDNIEIPQMTETIRDMVLQNASEDFDWSEISPTIFGAVFESTLNPETRRSGGMHYTSLENIHKVIDPLFLDDLRDELAEIKELKVEKTKISRLNEFREKLGSLTFLDPACGSGNFLTETYTSLRTLENEALEEITKGQVMMDFGDVIKVKINQFYGIEINDFAVTVATAALWIAESQMMMKTEELLHRELDFLPLKSISNIVEANALRIDWETVVPKHKLNYIMGNPPFVGQRYISASQHEDLIAALGNWPNSGKMDYVTGWYKKACDHIENTNIRCALVSTNSICQGEQVSYLWEPLFRKGMHIDFAHKTFRWDSEANIKAHVHCIIVGFSVANSNRPKLIYSSETPKIVKNINGYLIDADNIFIQRRTKPICDVPQMVTGNRQADGGHLTLSKEEKELLISKEPQSAKFIRKMLGSEEFIKNKDLYCLWLLNASPSEIRQMPLVLERVRLCQEHRLAGKPDRKRLADTPTLFREQINPDSAIIIPTVSSEKRKYVPMGFIDKSIIVNANAQVVADARLYHLGVLTSNVHMAWMRAVCGRLETRYRYSKDVVYNNFPWPNPTDEQKVKIEQTAQAILNARALYPDSSLADLYDELTMPAELRRAHQLNDKAVMEAYGFWGKLNTESECVAELMKLYQKLTSDK